MHKQTTQPKKKVKTTHTPSSNPPVPVPVPSSVVAPVIPPTAFSIGKTPVTPVTTTTPVLPQPVAVPVAPTATPPPVVKHKPKYTQLSKPGKGTHFPAKLPKRATRKDTLNQYGGPSSTKTKFQHIYKKSERSGLPDSLTKNLRQQAQDDIQKGKQVTKEARDMAASSNPSLSDVGAQRNHTFAAESALTAFSGGLAVLTTHGTSKKERDDARKHMKTISKTLTGDDPAVTKQISKKIDDIESDEDSDGAAELASELAKKTADHRHNVDLGHGGKNQAMSNRTDVTTSPGRTSISEKDADLLEDLDEPLEGLLGPTMRTNLLSVPLSPGKTHYLSSKRYDK